MVSRTYQRSSIGVGSSPSTRSHTSRYSSYSSGAGSRSSYTPKSRRAASVEPDYTSPYSREYRGGSVDRATGDRFVVGYASVTTKSKPSEQHVHITPTYTPPVASIPAYTPPAASAPTTGFAPHISSGVKTRKYESDVVIDDGSSYGGSSYGSSLYGGLDYNASLESNLGVDDDVEVNHTRLHPNVILSRSPGRFSGDEDYISRRSVRASSASRSPSSVRSRTVHFPHGRTETLACRASSVSRVTSVGDNDYETVRVPRKRPRAASVSRYTGLENEVTYSTPYKSYARADADLTKEHHHVLRDMELARGGEDNDISNYVLEAGTNFVPTDIRVVVLPSGKKGVVYTRVSQTGSGDQSLANSEIEKIIARTKHLQESMYSLEEFVKRNRSWFPEDTLIYQHVEFFRLSEAQLRQIGEHPDAEVYGCNIKEKLVVPYGTDITNIMRRYYGNKSDYEVEYASPEGIRRREAEMYQQNERTRSMPKKSYYPEYEAEPLDSIRKKVELDFELRESKKPRYEPKPPRSHFVDSGVDYDSIYSHASTTERSMPSDQDSSVTPRKKRFDTSPQFMSKLRPKRCYEGQTIRFNCSVSGLPLPEVMWLKGNHVICEGPRHHLSVSTHVHL